MRSASSSWRCASTPSLMRPGSTPSSCEESWRTSSIVMISFSPALLITVQTPASSPVPSFRVHGGDIQLSGLYARSSAWMETLPSALTRIRRGAEGRWAVSRPA